MSTIDWVIFVIPILLIIGFSIYVQRFVRNTADFLVANRSGGRYLLTAASGISGIGVITFVAFLESYSQAGWAFSWWGNFWAPISIILALTGFVFYRYRQTRVLTMAQFFEIRYGRKFRIAMGLICFISGLINFGIFPAVTTQFFMVFLHLPQEWCGIPVYPSLMFILLGSAAWITIAGGQIQNMATDTLQGLFSYAFYIILGIAILSLFDVEQFRTVMTTSDNGQSLINPFETGKIKDFNLYFIAINLFINVYTYGAWQGGQGYSGAALNPHESKMGGILNTWRSLSMGLFLGTVALAALTYWKLHPDMTIVNAAGVASAAPKDAMITAIANFLPTGLKGIFAALMFFFMLSTDTTYLHSWGVIFIQDVALPIYGKPVSPRTHLLLLRLAIGFVAIFAFAFSIFYLQNDFIQMFQIATGAFFTAAGGCAIIGGLYWARGTGMAAWGALVVGVSASSINLFLMDRRGWGWTRDALTSLFGEHAWYTQAIDKCPLNGAWLGFIATISALSVYVLISLCNRKRRFNMDKMLHRNQYAITEDEVSGEDLPGKPIAWWKRFFLGFDNEFTLSDKLVSISVFSWVQFWFLAFVGITLWNVIGLLMPNAYIRPWTDDQWFDWMFYWGIQVSLCLAPIAAVWMTWGGVCDLFKMLKILRSGKCSDDDGFVPEEKSGN